MFACEPPICFVHVDSIPSNKGKKKTKNNASYTFLVALSYNKNNTFLIGQCYPIN